MIKKNDIEPTDPQQDIDLLLKIKTINGRK